MRKTHTKIVCLFTVLGALSLICRTAIADVTLKASDSAGKTSFNSALNWSDGAAPHAGASYLVDSGRMLRTPEGGGNYTFMGDSLTLNNGNINLKGTGNVTINDLQLYGCRLAMGQGGNIRIYGTNTIHGTAGAPSCYSGSQKRSTYIYALLQGSGEFQVERTPGENEGYFVCRLLGDNSGFTGGITVKGADITLGINSINSLGSELPSFRADALKLKDGGALYSIAPVTLDSPTRGITIENGGTLSGTTTEHKPITIETPVTGSGDLTINGIQLITLNSPTTIDGNIVADDGQLAIGPLFSMPASGKIILKNNGTLQQSASVVSDVSLEGGRINAGAVGAAGSMTLSNVLFQSGAFEFDFASGATVDSIFISGELKRTATQKFVIRLTKPIANESGNFALMTVANMGEYSLHDFELVSSYYNLPEGELEITGNTLYFNQARPVVFLSAAGNNHDASFTTGTCWSDGQVPNAANDYIVDAGYRLRSNTDFFGGRSLTLSEKADLRLKTEHTTIPDLRLYSQRITHGTPPNIQYLAGKLSVLGPYDFENDGSLSRILVLESEMSGTADIRFKISVENPLFTVNGKFELRAANTNFTGAILVQGPQTTYLTISSEENLGGNPPALRANQLELKDGGILAVANSVTLDDTNRGITLSGTGGTLDVAGNATLTIACPLAGTNLNKRGSGTLALSGNNSHTGGTFLEAGTLEIRSKAALGTGPLTFGNNTACKVLVDSVAMPHGARVADLLGTTLQVQPLFAGKVPLGIDIPLFLLTSPAPTVTAEDITLTGIPAGHVAVVASKEVDDNGTIRMFLYTKYIVPGTILTIQ